MSQSPVAEQKLTPMMEQYLSIKKTLPSDTILFFRLGDFYEMFFEDALRASEILDITLTGREGGEAGRVPMCGVPYHAYQGYVKTLLDHRLKVAICEQMGDPKAAKGIVERKISRIISPATYLDDENKGKHSEYMAAVMQVGNRAALAYLELSTGEFYVREMERARLQGELSILNPREIILPKPLAESSLFAFIQESLRATVTVYENWIFEAVEGTRLMKETFHLASTQAISFHDKELCLGAVGSILYYLRDHLHSASGHIHLPTLLDATDYMVLDRQTQLSLELVSTLASKKDSVTLLSCMDQTLTCMGARMLYQWLTHPLRSLEEIQKRQESIRELVQDQETLHGFRNLFKGVKDMERTLSRLNYGVANARDLVNLKQFLEKAPEIQEAAKKCQSRMLKELSKDIRPFPNLAQLIESSIAELPPLSLREGGIIRDGFSAALDELRAIAKNGKSWIAEFERREIERTGIKSLKVKYSGVFGYTLEISKSNLSMVPADYIRRQTLANGERFIVPELKNWDEKISGAEDKMKALEYQLFNDVREKVLQELSPLQAFARAVAALDVLSSLALVAIHKKWVCAHLDESNDIVIEGGRHPVVETMLPAGQFVENDTCLNDRDEQLIILTGPNMAGKSTYIRQIAQIVLLAQMGSFVPATRARIGLVDRIFTRIGASDDLAKGESTFMVEMLETAHILQSATNKSLLILDEVGRGTSTFDGVSIAWAICEYLASGKIKPRTLFATHYHELTQLEEHFANVKNYHITVKETKDGIIFLRKVVTGGSDRSYGIHVARLAGIPKAVTERAEEILRILESENTEATQIIEGQKVKGEGRSKKEPSLFDFGITQHPILEEIKNLYLDTLMPLEALNKLAEWKKRVTEE